MHEDEPSTESIRGGCQRRRAGTFSFSGFMTPRRFEPLFPRISGFQSSAWGTAVVRQFGSLFLEPPAAAAGAHG